MKHVRRVAIAVVVVLLASRGPAAASPGTTIELPLRGRSVSITIYEPPRGKAPAGTVIIGSGDVGWVGLAVSVAEFLSDRGYVVAGVNVRRYLSAFTSGQQHIQVQQVPADYRVIADHLDGRGLLRRPIVLSGVSEGAALAVAAGADCGWANGVLTMGLPATAELAWRWTDFATWITKKDADEPSFAPADLIARVAPRPLWMIQSTKDEYVPEADYRRFEAVARSPKRLVLIDAANHRFTDRMPQLREAILAGLAWIASGGK